MNSKKSLLPLSSDLRLNSFFAGIGGFELAFERKSFEIAFHCEKDPFCRAVLRRHWPGVRSAPDINELSATDIPDASVWTAGFPCQDLSLARTPHGRSGLRGKQSGLFFKFHELVAAHLPKVVLVENVVGLLNSHQGADLRALVSSLTELGYGVAWRVLNARYFGVPQSRPRIFICAWHNSPRRAAQVLFEERLAAPVANERVGFVTQSRAANCSALVPHVAFCVSATSGRHTGLDWARSYIAYGDSVRRPTPLECERLQGFPDNWTKPHAEYPIPIRGNDTDRYKAVGNAVCVPVVEWVANRVHQQLEKGTRNRSRERASADFLRSLAAEFREPGVRSHQIYKTSAGAKWNCAGIAFGSHAVDASASTAPFAPRKSRLIDVVERQKVDDRYFLSPNAAQGILRRVERMGRRLFGPLEGSLRILAASDASLERPDYALPKTRPGLASV